jgi:hypothetical protein
MLTKALGDACQHQLGPKHDKLDTKSGGLDEAACSLSLYEAPKPTKGSHPPCAVKADHHEISCKPCQLILDLHALPKSAPSQQIDMMGTHTTHHLEPACGLAIDVSKGVFVMSDHKHRLTVNGIAVARPMKIFSENFSGMVS